MFSLDQRHNLYKRLCRRKVTDLLLASYGFDINASKGLSEEEKNRIKIKLAPRLTTDFILILNGEEDRSQLKNKTLVTKRFFEILKVALLVPKARKATKVPRSVIEKRIKAKRNNSEIKQNRRKPDFNS